MCNYTMIKNKVGINSPMITIGLPVYNGERFIQKRLDSLLKQSFENFEMIISDNASEDNTEQICKRHMEMDSRIVYFRQEPFAYK